jgi:TolA-binding protein
MRQSLVRLLLALWVGLLGVSFAYAAPATPADKAFAAAQQLYNIRLDAQAIDELTKFAATYPTDPRLHMATFMIGRAQQRQQKYDKALEAYAAVINKATAAEFAKLRADTHYQMAECYLAQKDFERAVKSYRSCLALSSADKDLTLRAQYWLAECLFQLNKLPEAVTEYRRVTEIAPEHALAPWAWYSIGDIELRRTNYTPAIAALEKVTTQYKDSEVVGEATLTLAFAYVSRARASASEAPNRATDYARAIALFSAVTDSPKSTPSAKQKAAVALGHAYFDQKDYSKAAAAYAGALDTLDAAGQTALEARLWRGHALYNNGQFEDALAEYTRVAGGRAADLALLAHYWSGNSWFQIAQKTKDARANTETIAAFQRYLKAPGDKPTTSVTRATLLIGFCYEDLSTSGSADAREKAAATFRDVLEKWPASREATEAQAGIARLTQSMTAEDLRKWAGNLPAAAVSSVALQLARQEFLAGRYQPAMDAAKKVVESKPAAEVLAQAYYLIGASQHKLGAVGEAITNYKAARDQAPDTELTPLIQRGLTQAYLDLRNYPEALTTAKALTDNKRVTGKELAEALMFLAEAYLNNGRSADAMSTYQRVIKEFPTTALVPNALLGLAWVAETKKDRTLAIATYGELVGKYPDHPLVADAYFHLGFNYAEQKEFADAIKAYKGVPSTHRLADQAAYAIAWAYRDQGKHEESNAQFAKIAELFPKSPLASDGLYRIGEYWLERKNYTDAMVYFGRAQDLAPAEKLAPLIGYKLGVCAFYAGQFSVAADAFGKVTANSPTSEYAAESLFWKAQAQEKQGTLTPARETYVQYLTKYPKQKLVLDAAVGAGRAALLQKQYLTARTDLAKALQLCDELGKGTDAELAERAKNVAPEAQYHLAQSYFEEKKYEQASKEYAAVAFYGYEPWSSRSLYQLAECSALNSNPGAANIALSTLLKNFPGSDAAKAVPELAKKYGLTLPTP